MGTTWGHTLVLLPTKERLALATNGTCGCGGRCRHLCTMGRATHRERPVFQASWEYVTGRAMRTSTATKTVCVAHGAAFAAKHGLDVPEVPPLAQAAIDRERSFRAFETPGGDLTLYVRPGTSDDDADWRKAGEVAYDDLGSAGSVAERLRLGELTELEQERLAAELRWPRHVAEHAHTEGRTP